MVVIVTDQNHSSAQAHSSEIRALKKQLEDYRSQHNTLERKVKRLERDVRSVETELKVLDDLDYVDRETVVDLIHEIALSPKSKKDSASAGIRNFSYTIETDTSEESDSGEIVEESHGYQVREKKAVPHALAPLAKQRRKVRPRRVKRLVV